ncbi:MAG: hypothetical protein IKI59_09290 [Clostridia bacterium]|nr:hypothetical protein [Clostridia bacterium]
MANEQTKTKLPLTAVGLYICAGIMAVLFVLSIVGIAIGGQDGTRPTFIMAALLTAVMLITSLLSAKWVIEKAAARKPKAFASYAFEGEFAPKKKPLVYPKKETEKGKK